MSNMNIAHEFMKLDEVIRSGTLCMFGCWFGRPMDNYHRSCFAESDGEILEVWNPSQLIIDSRELKIPKVTKVKWSWYYYGRPKTPENLHYLEYIPNGNCILSGAGGNVIKNVSINEAAVAIC